MGRQKRVPRWAPRKSSVKGMSFNEKRHCVNNLADCAPIYTLPHELMIIITSKLLAGTSLQETTKTLVILRLITKGFASNFAKMLYRSTLGIHIAKISLPRVIQHTPVEATWLDSLYQSVDMHMYGMAVAMYVIAEKGTDSMCLEALKIVLNVSAKDNEEKLPYLMKVAGAPNFMERMRNAVNITH